jgi:hypothetical protein
MLRFDIPSFSIEQYNTIDSGIDAIKDTSNDIVKLSFYSSGADTFDIYKISSAHMGEEKYNATFFQSVSGNSIEIPLPDVKNYNGDFAVKARASTVKRDKCLPSRYSAVLRIYGDSTYWKLKKPVVKLNGSTLEVSNLGGGESTSSSHPVSLSLFKFNEEQDKWELKSGGGSYTYTASYNLSNYGYGYGKYVVRADDGLITARKNDYITGFYLSSDYSDVVIYEAPIAE